MSSLAKLTQSAKKASPQKSNRPTVDVPAFILPSFKELAYAKSIYDVAGARKDAEAVVVCDAMLEAYAETLFKQGFVPANPTLMVLEDGKPDISGIFQVQHRFKINIPKDVDGDTDVEKRFVAAFVAIGMDSASAKKIFDNEIDGRPVVMLRPFSELVNGHYEDKSFVESTQQEKDIGEKLLRFVFGEKPDPLTDQEKDLAVFQQENIKVKDGFLQRLRLYCDTLDQLKGVLRVISPVHYVSHIKVGISDTPERLNERLAAKSSEFFGD